MRWVTKMAIRIGGIEFRIKRSSPPAAPRPSSKRSNPPRTLEALIAFGLVRGIVQDAIVANPPRYGRNR